MIRKKELAFATLTIITVLFIGCVSTASAEAHDGEIISAKTEPDPLVSELFGTQVVTVKNTGTDYTPFELEICRSSDRLEKEEFSLYAGDTLTLSLGGVMGDPGPRTYTYRLYWDRSWPKADILLDTFVEERHCFSLEEVSYTDNEREVYLYAAYAQYQIDFANFIRADTTEAESLLQHAMIALNEGKYQDAKDYANQSKDSAEKNGINNPIFKILCAIVLVIVLFGTLLVLFVILIRIRGKTGACCPVCGKKSRIRYKLNKQYVCKECWKKGQEEYLRAIIEKWQECPICRSKEGFEIKVGLVSKLVCKSCLAEWILSWTMIGGEIKGIRLIKADSENRAVRYLLKKHPPEWWAEKKWTEERTGKEEAENKVTETKEEPVEKMEIGKYERLGKYLNGLKEKEVTLTFEQIEYILGFQLPSSARQYPAWWANDKTHSHAVNGWLNCGWQSRNLKFSEKIVQFFQVNKKAECNAGKMRYNLTLWEMCVNAIRKLGGDNRCVRLKEIIEKVYLMYPETSSASDAISAELNYHTINMQSRFPNPANPRAQASWMKVPRFYRCEVGMYRLLNEDEIKLFEQALKRDCEVIFKSEYTIDELKACFDKAVWIGIGEEAKEYKKEQIEIIIERAIYDPCKRDFVEGRLPRMKEWINRYDPGAYWFAVSIQNNTDKAIEEWGVDLEFSSALKIKEAKIEGIEIEIPHEAHLGLFKISVPKEYGIVIPKGGAQRVYFKLRADKPKTTYEISGVFKSIVGEVPIRAKEFKYLCDTGVSPEAVKAELNKTFSEKDAARLANTFRVAQEIRSSYCNTDTKAREINKEFDLLKMYLTEREFLTEIENIQRKIKAELREDERLDERHVEAIKDFCEKFTEMWIARFLR